MLRGFALLVSVLVLLLAVSNGCSTTPHPATPEQIARESTEEPPDETAIAALEGLKLDASQRQSINELRERLRSDFAAANEARYQLVDALVVDIAAGRLDRARINPLSQQLAQAVEQAKPKLLAAVNELHAILTPAQREALVAGIAKRHQERQGEQREQMERMIDLLDLTFWQKRDIYRSAKDRLSGRKKELEQLKEQLEDAAEAFKRDDFDAHELALVQNVKVADWLELSLTLVEIILPVLEPSQHKALAAIIERRLSARKQPATRRPAGSARR
jgi:Spy/CpxP family protein refolding chaperone